MRTTLHPKLEERLRSHLVRLAGVAERPGGASSLGGVVQREGGVELRRDLLEPLVVGGKLSEDAEGVVLELCPQLLRDGRAAKLECGGVLERH